MIRRTAIFIIAIVAILSVTTSVSQAQSVSTLHVPDAVRTGLAVPIGRLAANQVMTLHVILPLRDPAGLKSFLSDVYNPASPVYRHFLTVPEFTERFGPVQADYDGVVRFVTTSGFAVVGGSRDGMDVQIKGPVSAVETAFHLQMWTYQHPTENRTFYAPAQEPTANLPFSLWHISGLDNYSIPRPLFVKKSDYAKAHNIEPEAVVSHATTGSGPSASFLGSDMRAAYYAVGAAATLTGKGQNLGLLEFKGTNLADLTTYFKNTGQTNSVPITLLSTDGTSTSCLRRSGCDDAEQTLDMTQALGMAPGLSSLVVYIGSTDTAIISAMTTHTPLPTTIGCSWGWTPADPSTLDPYFEKMAAQGQTFFSASGDSSTWSATNSAWPADDANVVSVGGTDLITNGAAGPWGSETAWADSGGGISPDNIPIPGWQQISGVINSTNQGSTTYRNGPDVSANADFSFYVCADQTACTANEYGGTSFAAPMWAGYMALVNQQLAINSQPPIGFLNPVIYAQNVTSNYDTDFHDITSGTSGSYSAVTGYDLVTGWGSPNAGLINALTTPGFGISASPASVSVLRGGSGSSTITSTVTDGFSSAITLSASGQPAGVTIAFNPASITGAGTSTMTLTVAAGTALGTYPVTITAAGGGLSQSALVTLQIYVPATAVLVKTDATTQGTWKGVYGGDGQSIPNDSANDPSYAQVNFNGATPYTWAASTMDVRALQQGAGSGRIASAWYASPSFTIDVNLIDGNAHEVGLYCLDWDNQGRAEKIDVMDAVSGNVLDSRSVSAFGNGTWLLWNLSGHVTLRVTATAGSNAVVSGIFFSPPAQPDFLLSPTPASQIVSRGGSTTYTVTVNSSAGFAGTVTLSASGLPSGANVSFNPAAASAGNSSTMTVTTTAATPGGGYSLTVTGTSGSLSHSATVTLMVQVPVPAAAMFVKTDTATQGTWKGAYGADGEAISNDSANYPVYALVNLTGATAYTWASSTTDVRGLQKAAASDRIASTWYTGTNFTFDVNLTDGNPHEVGLYCLDWDNQGRAERIDILDAASGSVLDTRNASAFNNGTWLLWNLSGHVTIKVTVTGGPNAAVSGIFFNSAAPADFSLAATPATQVVAAGGSAAYTVTVTPLVGFSGTVSLSASGLPSSATATFNPTTITGSGSSTMTIATTTSAPGGGYSVTVSGTSGSLSHTASATLVVSVPAPAAAFFVKTDTATQGTWKGAYGADGETIANDSANYPPYAQAAFNGATLYTWSSSTTDARALQKAAAGDRIASTWYATPSFTIDLNLLYGGAHQVALYCLDWDNAGRAERIDILDASSGSLLDTESISAFNNGVWLVWNLTGHVTIKVTLTGGAAGTTAAASGVFFDPAPAGFSLTASPGSQTILQGNSAAYTVNVSSSGGFTGAVNFSASGLPAGATATFNPASVNGSGSSTLTVATNASTPGGTYNLTVTGASGSASHSSTVALSVNVPAPATALFANMDTTTQGTWKGVYGGDGEAIVNDPAHYPAYATVNVNGANTYTWSSSTSDVRALQKAAATDRIASTWYSSLSFSFDVNLTDGNSHEVGIYCLDWDNAGRTERIDVLDAVSGSVLDTRNASAFTNGVWFLWNLTGHVTIRVTLTGGESGTTAVASGIFFNSPAPPGFSLSATPVSQTVAQGGSAPYTVTVNALLGFTGNVNLAASGLPSGATASFSQPSVTGAGSVTMTLTAGAATPGGAYNITVTGTSGSVSHSASVTLLVSVPVAAAASFVKIDTTTQGTWKGLYGAAGEGIANDSLNYPGYAQVTFTGTPYTWAPSTTDGRALETASGSSRIASAWYSSSTFTINLNLADGNPHNVAIYCLDWDGNNGRAETISLLDASNNNVLDTRSISAFGSGEWLVWTLSGHVIIQITPTGGPNAVVSGLFINN